jgi:hypothetical protein
VSDQPGLRLVAVSGSAPGTVRLDGAEVSSITAALDAARPGSVVEVGRGRYDDDTETYPLRVPDGVTLRGPAPPDIPREARKHLPPPTPASLVAGGPVLDVVGTDVRIEQLHLRSTRPGTGPTLAIGAVGRAVVDSCTLSGSMHATDVCDLEVRWTTIEHGRLVVRDTHTARIVGGGITGTHGAGALIDLRGGATTRIEAMALTDAVVGVATDGCDDVLVSGCAVLADDTAVRTDGSRHVGVSGNRLRGRRAVHLIGCGEGGITANGVEWAEVAFTLEESPGITVAANHIGEARVETTTTLR